MKKIITKEDVKQVRSLKTELDYVEQRLLKIQNSNPNLLSFNEHLEVINKIDSECDAVISEFTNTIDENLSKLIKKGNTILIKTTDAVSYYENQYYHILNDEPDWRDLIKVSLVKVGHSDFGNWISTEGIHYISQEDLLNLLKEYKHSLVDYGQMAKYIEFSKTIPE